MPFSPIHSYFLCLRNSSTRLIALAREKNPVRVFRPEINEEPQKVSQDAGQNSSSGVPDRHVSISDAVGKSELEQMTKQMIFTRSESDAMITQLASPQDPTTIENLPEDLLSKIFIRLLAKQLAQMRSVSKSWNGHLSESSFVKSHLHHSIKSKDRILLVFYYPITYSNPKGFTAIPCGSPHLELTNFIKLPWENPQSRPQGYDLVGSFHGLVCTRDCDDAIHFWNPSLSAVSTLPPYLGPHGDCIFFRFGFDPSTHDYKVVKISGLAEDPEWPYASGVKEWQQVEIYSMRKGCWKLITERVPFHIAKIYKSFDVSVDGHDGHLHWLGFVAKKKEAQTIVAFDLGSETFRELPLPDFVLLDKNDERLNLLGVFTGKLCVMSRSWSEDDGIDLWVMDEYGVAESWVKRLTFSPPGFDGCMSTGFTSNNEFIYKNTDRHKDRHLVLYDPVADKAKILEKSRPKRHGAHKIVEYIDSLVWVSPPSIRHQMS